MGPFASRDFGERIAETAREYVETLALEKAAECKSRAPKKPRRKRDHHFFSRARPVMMQRAYYLATRRPKEALRRLKASGGRVTESTTPFHAVLRLILGPDNKRITKLAAELRYAAAYEIDWKYLIIFRELTGDSEDIRSMLNDGNFTVHTPWTKYLKRPTNPERAPKKRRGRPS